ncbi:MAG: hypothetical protein J6Z30_02815 [Pyramidobacter sp.]|nr:hypothetical protein [Pyramidobacter sp.]
MLAQGVPARIRTLALNTGLSGSSATTSRQLLSDRNNFRASLGLDAKKNNLTIGVGVNALLSSGQKDVAVNATLRWDL